MIQTRLILRATTGKRGDASIMNNVICLMTSVCLGIIRLWRRCGKGVEKHISFFSVVSFTRKQQFFYGSEVCNNSRMLIITVASFILGFFFSYFLMEYVIILYILFIYF